MEARSVSDLLSGQYIYKLSKTHLKDTKTFMQVPFNFAFGSSNPQPDRARSMFTAPPRPTQSPSPYPRSLQHEPSRKTMGPPDSRSENGFLLDHTPAAQSPTPMFEQRLSVQTVDTESVTNHEGQESSLLLRKFEEQDDKLWRMSTSIDHLKITIGRLVSSFRNSDLPGIAQESTSEVLESFMDDFESLVESAGDARAIDELEALRAENASMKAQLQTIASAMGGMAMPATPATSSFASPSSSFAAPASRSGTPSVLGKRKRFDAHKRSSLLQQEVSFSDQDELNDKSGLFDESSGPKKRYASVRPYVKEMMPCSSCEKPNLHYKQMSLTPAGSKSDRTETFSEASMTTTRADKQNSAPLETQVVRRMERQSSAPSEEQIPIFKARRSCTTSGEQEPELSPTLAPTASDNRAPVCHERRVPALTDRSSPTVVDTKIPTISDQRTPTVPGQQFPTPQDGNIAAQDGGFSNAMNPYQPEEPERLGQSEAWPAAANVQKSADIPRLPISQEAASVQAPADMQVPIGVQQPANIHAPTSAQVPADMQRPVGVHKLSMPQEQVNLQVLGGLEESGSERPPSMVASITTCAKTQGLSKTEHALLSSVATEVEAATADVAISNEIGGTKQPSSPVKRAQRSRKPTTKILAAIDDEHESTIVKAGATLIETISQINLPEAGDIRKSRRQIVAAERSMRTTKNAPPDEASVETTVQRADERNTRSKATTFLPQEANMDIATSHSDIERHLQSKIASAFSQEAEKEIARHGAKNKKDSRRKTTNAVPLSATEKRLEGIDNLRRTRRKTTDADLREAGDQIEPSTASVSGKDESNQPPSQPKDGVVHCEQCQKETNASHVLLVSCKKCDRCWHQHCLDPVTGEKLMADSWIEWICNNCRVADNAVSKDCSSARGELSSANHVDVGDITIDEDPIRTDAHDERQRHTSNSILQEKEAHEPESQAIEDHIEDQQAKDHSLQTINNSGQNEQALNLPSQAFQHNKGSQSLTYGSAQAAESNNNKENDQPTDPGPQDGAQSKQPYRRNRDPNKPKRRRRRPEEVERRYKCLWVGCDKAYGEMPHLNKHIDDSAHGVRMAKAEYLTKSGRTDADMGDLTIDTMDEDDTTDLERIAEERNESEKIAAAAMQANQERQDKDDKIKRLDQMAKEAMEAEQI